MLSQGPRHRPHRPVTTFFFAFLSSVILQTGLVAVTVTATATDWEVGPTAFRRASGDPVGQTCSVNEKLVLVGPPSSVTSTARCPGCLPGSYTHASNASNYDGRVVLKEIICYDRSVWSTSIYTPILDEPFNAAYARLVVLPTRCVA